MGVEISYQRYESTWESKFSILIPTWNNLEFAKLCVRSLRQNSRFPHELILHINEGNDGTLEWARSEKIPHSYSKENVGVCHALNAASELATTDYICFFNDDMYALPDWDVPFLEEIEKLNHNEWFLSGTMIEPRDTGNQSVIAPRDYGQDIASFREKDLLHDFLKWPKEDWSGATWPPNIVPKQLWEAVGGYSIEFSPGMSSDPDFSRKVWESGVRYFKGLAEARVDQFQAKSSGKVTKDKGSKQFLKKRGLTQSTFVKYYLRRGEDWKGPQKNPAMSLGLLGGKLKSFIKRL